MLLCAGAPEVSYAIAPIQACNTEHSCVHAALLALATKLSALCAHRSYCMQYAHVLYAHIYASVSLCSLTMCSMLKSAWCTMLVRLRPGSAQIDLKSLFTSASATRLHLVNSCVLNLLAVLMDCSCVLQVDRLCEHAEELLRQQRKESTAAFPKGEQNGHDDGT